MGAKEKSTIKRFRLDPQNPRRLTAREAQRLDAAKIDYSEIPALTEAWLSPSPKKQLTIRLDADVLDWLKKQGRGYQTRINRILRYVMENQPR